MGAPLNPVPQVIRVVLGGTAGGRPWANILHFGYSGSAVTNANAGGMAEAISNNWSINVASLCPSPIQLDSVTVSDLTSPTGGEAVWNAVHAGTRGDDTIGGNTAVLISYGVQSRFKGGHPRTYLLCLGNADNASTTQWHPTAATEVQAHWQAFLTATLGYSIGGSTIATFGFVRYHGKFLPNEGPPHYYLTNPQFLVLNIANSIAQVQMASQRRRIGRVRR